MQRIEEGVKLTREFLILTVFSLFFFAIMSVYGHENNPKIWATFLIIFSCAKTYFLTTHTFKKMNIMLEEDHSTEHLLFLLSTILVVVIFSFSLDYLCLSEIDANAFEGLDANQALAGQILDIVYFTIVTFASLGYGDITPLSGFAKMLVILEIITSFILIIFVVSDYRRRK